MTLIPQGENAFYDAILQREHHFYNSFSRGATLANEIYKKTLNYQHRIILALAHTHSAWKCPRWEWEFWKKSSSHSMINAARHEKTNEKRMKMYKNQSMLINHTLTIAKVRFIKLRKRLCTSTTSNICIKPLRLPMKWRRVKSWENVCKSNTLYISSQAAARTCFMMIRGIERRQTKTITFHNP